MADSDLSLLFKLRADNAQAKTALAETRAAVTQLRTSFGSDLSAMSSASKSAFSDIGNHLNVFVGERIPLVGGAFIRVTENLHGLHDEMKKGGPEVEKLAKSIESIAQSSGKSTHEVTKFLTSFVQLENQAKRDAAAIETFGAVTAQKLIPQLEKAGTELSNVATTTESTGSSLAAMAGPIGLVVLAVGAMVAGLAVAGEKLFEITKTTAEWEGKLFDLSQQTGVSVETLSALEAVARQTGSSLEAITASLGIFQKHLETAQDPTSKEALLLQKLGIDATNTEEALRQTLARLARMPEGFTQTATALELFGRGGKALLAILKETHGDLDATIERLDKMGLLVHTETAKAADEFNDKLDEVQRQLRATAGIIGNEAMPVILDAIKQLSIFLDENRGTLANWVHDVEDAARGAMVFGRAIEFVSGSLNDLIGIPIPKIFEYLSPGGLAGIRDLLALFGQSPDIPAVPVTDTGPVPIGPPRPGTIVHGVKTPKGGGGGTSAKDEQYKADLEASAEAAKQELELQRHLNEQLRLAHEESLIDLEQFYKGRQKLIDDHFNTVIDQINKEQAAVDNARARGRIKAAEADKKDADLVQRTNEAKNKLSEESHRLSFEREQARDKADLALENQLLAIREAQREGELARISDALDRQQITESEAIARRQAIYEQAYNDRKTLLDLELGQLSTSADRKLAIDNQKIASEQKYTDEFERLTRQRIEAIGKESAARAAEAAKEAAARRAAEALGRGAVGGAANAVLHANDALKQQLGTVNLLRGAYEGLASSIGQGVGSLIESFVLMGKVGPDAFRKVVAAALASVAARAAADSIYELAIGFAALTPWGAAIYGPAPLHFHAAALLAGIAGVAAAAGRVAAGGAFQQPATGSGSGAGAGGGGSTTSPTRTQPVTTEINRQVGSQAPVVNVHIHGEAATAFNYKVLKAVHDDYRGNGKTRQMITTDGRITN